MQKLMNEQPDFIDRGWLLLDDGTISHMSLAGALREEIIYEAELFDGKYSLNYEQPELYAINQGTSRSILQPSLHCSLGRYHHAPNHNPPPPLDPTSL